MYRVDDHVLFGDNEDVYYVKKVKTKYTIQSVEENQHGYKDKVKNVPESELKRIAPNSKTAKAGLF